MREEEMVLREGMRQLERRIAQSRSRSEREGSRREKEMESGRD